MKRDEFMKIIRNHGLSEEDTATFQGLLDAMLVLLPEVPPATTPAQVKVKIIIDNNRMMALSVITAMVITECARCDVCADGIHNHVCGDAFEQMGNVVTSILKVIRARHMDKIGLWDETRDIRNPLAAAMRVALMVAERDRAAAAAHRAAGLDDDGMPPDAAEEASPGSPETAEEGGSVPTHPPEAPNGAHAPGDGPMGILRGGEDRV